MRETELRIHIWPEKILRKKCKEVKTVDNKIRELFNEMYRLMKSLKGVGLAANQAGLDLNMMVIEAEDRLFKLVNPVLLKKEGIIKFKEGCLSFPGIELEIRRANRIWVSSLDEYGNSIDLEFEGVLSVIFQHEFDHLNGVVFIDRVSLIKKLSIYPKLRELKKYSYGV